MLNESQDERLHQALGVLVEAAPDGSELTMMPPPQELTAATPARWRRPALVGAVAFVVLLAVFLPLAFMGGEPESQPSNPSPSAAPPPEEPVATVLDSEQPAPSAISLGGAVKLAPPGETRSLVASEGSLYAAVPGPTDRIMRSVDDGVSWEVVLEADPGDAEGLFGAGRLVVQVIEDDNPARDTVTPNSVVNDAPRVLVYDPATGEHWETALPRPVDPVMEPLSLDGSADTCALGGYQSWVQAGSVAVGDRLVVSGQLELVGKLGDGTVFCDGQVYQNVTWTSDDDGRTWELNDSRPLGAISWTGERFVAWSTSPRGTGLVAPGELVTSTNGVDWVTSASAPRLPEGTFSSGSAIDAAGDVVIAWAGVSGWVTSRIPEEVTDPEQLREALYLADDEVDITDVLAEMGVDLPLDDQERATIAAFSGASEPVGAIIAVSADGGATWTTTLVDEPITGVVGVEAGFVALTSVGGDPTNPADDRSALLTSSDGIDWAHSIELPEFAFGPRGLTASTDAVYLVGRTGSLWLTPAS